MAQLDLRFFTMLYWDELLPNIKTFVEVAPIRLEDYDPYDVKAGWAAEFYVFGIERNVLMFPIDIDAGPDPLVPQKVQMINMFGDGLYSFILNNNFSDFVYKYVLKYTAWVPLMNGHYDWSFSTIDDFILFDEHFPGLRLSTGVVDFENMQRI